MDEYRHYKVSPEPLSAAARVGIAGSVPYSPDSEVSLREQAETLAKSAADLYNVLDELVNGPRPTAPIGKEENRPFPVIQQVRLSLCNTRESLAGMRDLLDKLTGEIGG